MNLELLSLRRFSDENKTCTFGPWNLCALQLAKSTKVLEKSKGKCAIVCTVSEWKYAPFSLQIF